MSKILYNDGKWDGVWDLPKYQEMRDKILDAFKGLEFVEDGHKYFLNGQELTCVSNVAHLFQEHFDAHTKAFETFERNYDNPDSKYYRMTAEQIEKAWELNSKHACEHGTERHEFSENIFYFMTRQYDKISPAFKDRLTEDGGFKAIYPKEEAAVKFYEELPQHMVPILAETKVFDTELGYSGTFDLLCYYDADLDPNPKSYGSGLFVLDWKTNKDLFKNFNEKKLLPPFDGLLDMPLSIYKLQLSLYMNCLDKIGMKVVGRCLMWLRPDGNYDKISLESYMPALRKALKEKKEQNLF